MDLLISYCPRCGSTGEILFRIFPGQIVPEFFEQECVFCDIKLDYADAHLTNINWLDEIGLKEYLKLPGD